MSAHRLSEKERLILGLLARAAGQTAYGLQLVALSGGALSRGTVYLTLYRMAEKGLVRSWQEEKAPTASGIARRLYQPTALGSASIASATEVPRG